jgi:hypothetical protein
MKNATKLIALLIAASLFTACGGNNSTPSPAPAAPASEQSAEPAKEAEEQAPVTAEEVKTEDVKAPGNEEVTLTIFGCLDSKHITKPVQEDPVMVELAKRTGVTLDMTADMGVTDRGEKLVVLLAGDDLPDITIWTAERPPVLKAGVALPLDDLVESHGRDIIANAEHALKISKLLKSDDTHNLNFLPGGVNSNDIEGAGNTWQIRWDLYKQLGAPKIDTYGQFLDVLEQMMALEPENSAGQKNYGLGLFLAETWGCWASDLAYGKTRGMEGGNTNAYYYDMKTDSIKPRIGDADTFFWECMAFYNKAYQRGILDPESVTLSFQAQQEKAKAGRYVGMITNWSGGAEAQWLSEGHPEKGYAPILVENDKEYIMGGLNNSAGNPFDIFINKKCKYPERAMDLLNYLYTFDGQELLMNGVEGVHYTMVNNYPVISAETINERQTDPDYSSKTGVWKYSNMYRIQPPMDPRGYPVNFMDTPETKKLSMMEYTRDFLDYYKLERLAEILEVVPNHIADDSLSLSLSLPVGSDAEAKSAQVEAYIEGNFAKAIYAESDDAFIKERDTIVSTLKSLGVDDVVECYRQMYEDMKTELASMN